MPLTPEQRGRLLGAPFRFEAANDVAGVLGTLAESAEHDLMGRPFGLEGRGRPLQYRMLHLIDFTEDGWIARENVCMDFPAIVARLRREGRP